jgi:cytochrome P450
VNSPSAVDALWHFDNYDRLREGARAYLGDADGHPFWMITRMDDIRSVLQDPSLFSSRAAIPNDPHPQYHLIPEMLDPPAHTKWRQLLGPTFSPSAVARLEPRVSEVFSQILDDILPRGECDYVADVALRFPNTIFMEIMGLPHSEAAQFQAWETAILHSGPMGTAGPSLQAMGEVTEYFQQLVAERRKRPKNDLVSSALQYTLDGMSVSDEDILSMCLLLFMAGLDTVAMQLSYSMMHLATHEDDRQSITGDPALIPGAIEEFLRYYSFVTPGRQITDDRQWHDCDLRRDEIVFLPLVAANRDPHQFRSANEVIIDRENNRHIAFGAGPHRCLGSHLARQELRIALTQWHARLPDYGLRDGAKITEHGGAQIGIDTLPIVWEAPT